MPSTHRRGDRVRSGGPRRDGGDYRFVHALTRDAVEASLTTADRVALHRAVAEATAAQFAGDLADHLTEIARHWAQLAPYGEAATARKWAIQAGDDAVRRLAYEEGARLYRATLAFDATPLCDVERCRVLVALGRAAYFAGDLHGCVDAALGAADAAGAAQSPELAAEAALVLEARYVGRAEDGKLRVVTLWQSKTHADRFFTETLGPVLAEALGPEPVGVPEAIGIDVARSYVREPLA
ncbi:MAG: hypothetical protein M3378_00835 [Actinomycetota bacterium]|nr:hypothetical protein [Actinomycetota bacterium]